MAKRTLAVEGRSVVGDDIGFRVVADGAVDLELDDGARLRLRQIVFNVVRTDERTPEGERLYLVQSVNHVLLVTPAEEEGT